MTDGEPETVVSASLHKIKSIKNPIKLFFFFFFFFSSSIKSETSDSLVSHFDGHFAYLKTLDFYFKGFSLLVYDCFYFFLGLLTCDAKRVQLPLIIICLQI